MSVFIDLFKTGGTHLGTLDYWRTVLMYMQQDEGSTTSQCITNFDEFVDLVETIAASVVDDT